MAYVFWLTKSIFCCYFWITFLLNCLTYFQVFPLPLIVVSTELCYCPKKLFDTSNIWHQFLSPPTFCTSNNWNLQHLAPPTFCTLNNWNLPHLAPPTVCTSNNWNLPHLSPPTCCKMPGACPAYPEWAVIHQSPDTAVLQQCYKLGNLFRRHRIKYCSINKH